jgi:hypothetical protein
MVALARVLPLCALLLVLPSMMLSGLAFAKGRPEFVYPADGQTLDSKGSYMFWVKPIANAEGFLWSILQNGVVVSERITGNEFGIHPGTPEHRKFLPGRIEVRVRALIKGQWTDPTIITISAVERQPVGTSQLTPSAPTAMAKYWWLLLLLPWPPFIYVMNRYKRHTAAKYPKLGVGEWAQSLTGAGILTILTIAVTARLQPQLGDWVAFLFVLWPILTYVYLTYFWRAAAKHVQRMEEVRETVLRKVLSQLPDGLALAMKQPLQRLCSNILFYEGAFENRRLSPQKIEEILYWLLYYWLLDRSRQLQLPNLLTHGEGDEATFPVPLHSLHTDVANSIQNVLNTIGQYSWDTDNYPFYGCPFNRLARTLYDNWAQVSGKDRNRPEDVRKKWVSPLELQDKLSVEALIRGYLDGTPFVDFLHTKVDVSIPHRSRFEHMHIVGGTGHGKTQLLQYLILHDLPHVASGRRSVIVIDSQGGLINEILSLASVGAMAERVVLIDPQKYIPALNLFDFGMDRLARYSRDDQEMLLNQAIELYKYLFGALLGAGLTQGQDVVFKALARLMMVVPDATIDNLIDFLKQPELTRRYVQKMDARGQRFFETEFFHSKYDVRREGIATRLWGVILERDLADMFAAARNKLDMADAMNRGSLILINTNKRRLGQEASAIFGRFFIALIGQATHEREVSDQSKLRDTFVYIDEGHEYFDARLGSLFEQGRKFGVGVVIAHQHLGQFGLGQFGDILLDTVMGNTAVKIVGGVSPDDARDFAKAMNCEREFLQGLRKHPDKKKPPYTQFACFVKDYTERAICLEVPFGRMKAQPKMTQAAYNALIQRNRARYGATNEPPPEKPKDDDSPLGDPELL